eukprot:gb/GECH01011824.1/.p1 GENE.gb/GECH01011824.1/~~gb/GECH01011824.1/.p1  ORF type:complete len:262 (+),score=47.54 gb/GECH01011824.1/:1-786(+)
MRYILLLAALLVVISPIALGLPSCEFKDDESGKSFDLTKLRNAGEYETPPYTAPSGSTYVYRFGICSNITTPCENASPDAACTQFKKSDCLAVTGKYNANTKLKVLDPKDPKVGVQVIYNNGDEGSHGERQTVIQIYCGDKAKDPKFMNETTFEDHKPGQQGPGYIYTISMTSPEACPKSGGGSGISPGSILLIIFFCGVIPLYFIIGIPVEMFVYKTEGWKRFVPNANFWLDLPFLLKDGFMFPIQCIQAARGSSSYSTV